ncbi:MAG: hypothetical protein Fur007_06320 [Rhodoferax sp.]
MNTAHQHDASGAARWLNLVLAVDRVLLQPQAQAAWFDALCHCVVAHSPVDLVWIGMRDDADPTLWPQSHAARDHDYLAYVRSAAAQAQVPGSLLNRALVQGLPRWGGTEALGSSSPPWRGVAALPLVVAQRTVGVVMLHTHQAGVFDTAARGVFEQLAQHLALALAHREADRARNEAQAVLAESEARYSALFANNCMPMLLIDPETAHIVDANIRAVNYYGYDAATLCGFKVSDINILPPEQIRAEMQAAAQAHKNHFDFRHRLASGDIRDVEVFSSPVSFGGKTYLLSTIHDVTQRRAEQAHLLRMQWLLQRFIDEIPGTVFLKDSQLRLLMVNRRLCEQIGCSREDLVGKTAREIFPKPFADIITDLDLQMLADGGQRTFEEHYQGRHLETHMFVIDDAQGERLVGGLSFDVTERYESAEFSTVLLQINELGGLLPEREFLTRGLEMAERLTHSEIAFLHFVNDDQQTLELVTWSSGALRGCTAAFDAHYPVDKAGIWADCVREKRPVMFNDYASYTAKRGLPDGHAPLSRLISVPVIEDDKVRMILGVGNKPAHYLERDIDTLSLIGNDLWRITRRARAEAALKLRLDEVTALNAQLAKAQMQLVQSEKMASVGQLAAGVAHEINNPIGFVKSNLGTLANYVRDLLEIYKKYQALAQAEPAQQAPILEAIRQAEAQADVAFMQEDLLQLVQESQDGVARVSQIVLDLKNFSRSGDTQWAWADLQAGFESTLNVVWNQLKYKAQLVREYAELPAVYCVASQINQVMMNLLVNAGQAIVDKGQIALRTGVQGDQVWFEVQDSGCGISPENQARLFEPFFTTKPQGQGTGLGLSISADIVQRHEGRIEVESIPGAGTRFRVWLPVVPTAQANAAASHAPHPTP